MLLHCIKDNAICGHQTGPNVLGFFYLLYFKEVSHKVSYATGLVLSLWCYWKLVEYLRNGTYERVLGPWRHSPGWITWSLAPLFLCFLNLEVVVTPPCTSTMKCYPTTGSKAKGQSDNGLKVPKPQGEIKNLSSFNGSYLRYFIIVMEKWYTTLHNECLIKQLNHSSDNIIQLLRWSKYTRFIHILFLSYILNWKL